MKNQRQQNPSNDADIPLRVCADCENLFEASRASCPHCQFWHSPIPASEYLGLPTNRLDAPSRETDLVPLSAFDGIDSTRIRTGPWDACFGGGLVSESVNLIAGDPGAGKTTLALQILEALLSSAAFDRAIYCYAEGGGNAIRSYYDRLHMSQIARILMVPAGTDPIQFLQGFDRPYPFVYDSISAGASVEKSAEIAIGVKEYSVRTQAPSLVLSHVNKEGRIAGIKKLEHMVDATYLFTTVWEKKKPTAKRQLSTLKNRFGPNVTIDLVLTESGLVVPTQTAT